MSDKLLVEQLIVDKTTPYSVDVDMKIACPDCNTAMGIKEVFLGSTNLAVVVIICPKCGVVGTIHITLTEEG